MLLAYRMGERAVFVYGFAKNYRDNISAAGVLTWRDVAADWLAADDGQLASAVLNGALKEIEDGEEAQPNDRGDTGNGE